MKKRNKKELNNKKYLLIIGIVIFILTFITILFFKSSLQEKHEIKLLEKEITMVTTTMNKKEFNYKKIKKYLNRNITTKERLIIEKSIESYLLDILTNTNKIITISKDKKVLNILTTKNIIKEKNDLSNTKQYLKDSKESLTKSINILKDISKNKYKYYKKINKNYKKKYKELLSTNVNIKKYIVLSDKLSKNIDIINESIYYIEKNKDFFKEENNNLIITKRKKLEEYNSILNKLKDIKLINYTEPKLIDDKTPPKIEATDISTTAGTNININDKIKCIDEVDDKVECSINGQYDINKTGTYKITIKATDKSNNTSTKVITITVNQKAISNGSYYTEVIRNQNTVIVYGQDSNGNYNKIVRVMPCSVGRSGQDTPTGTFHTSDKYRWGALYGGVYGQYATRIVSDILFHSVPYYSQNPGNLEWEEYNKLGSPASLGCVRMTVKDVKWIYDNCQKGMTVKIYDGNLPAGVSKPSAPKIPSTSLNNAWDTTDPEPNNHWNK